MVLPNKSAVRMRARYRSMKERSRSGSAMIEFAMLAMPFFMLLFGIIEVGLIFYGSCILEKATQDAARLIRTGQAQSGGSLTAEKFKTDDLCKQIAAVLSCNANLQVDVRSYGDFGSVNFTPPLDKDGNLDPNLDQFQTGGAGQVVLVRTFYTWNIVVPLLQPFFSNMSGGRRLLSATAAFRNEPFD
jgi:Flp pilus assembly protein TadG